MRYGQIRAFDIANGEGVRTSLFVVGCTHACPGCFNLEYQDFKAGKAWTDSDKELVLSHSSHPQVAGLSLLGGEPMQNTTGLIDLCKSFRERFGREKTIWIYSGYTFEQILKDADKTQLLSLCDVLVDGLFIEALKDLTLKFRGSSNQRLINIQESLQNKKVVLYEP